jgi:hypothetical protein
MIMLAEPEGGGGSKEKSERPESGLETVAAHPAEAAEDEDGVKNQPR